MDHGRTYFLDSHVWRNGTPEVDLGQDYVLHTSWESRTHTFVSFSRLLDTCDSQDYPLSDSRVTVSWGYGVEDDHEVAWGRRRRGSYDLYLLDQDHSRRIERGVGGEVKVVVEENLGVWSVRKRARIPSNETAYLCTMHRGPRLGGKHHVVGFDVHFPDTNSRDRVHHLIVFKCNAPKSLSSGIFEPFVGANGQPCYMTERPSTPMPAHFCTELYFGWATGGRAFFLPPHVGLPLGSSPNEYYMVQVHYDNPERRSNIVDLRLDFFYTSRLRDNDGGVMGVGHDIPGVAPSFLVPPDVKDHRVFGYCSSECTRRMFPDGGIRVFAGLLHTHNTGVRVRLRHFQDGDPVEQPYVLYDDNYSNGYQVFRHLHVERSVMPGDQLALECTYDTSRVNGSVVGGYATSQEMCFSFVVYYNKIPDYNVCQSEIVSSEYRDYFLGVGNITWVEGQLDWVAVTPRSMAGYTVKKVSDNFVDWGRKHELQTFHEGHPHVGKCSRDLYARSGVALQALVRSGAVSGEVKGDVAVNVDTGDDYSGVVGYPYRVKGYVPVRSCSFGGGVL